MSTPTTDQPPKSLWQKIIGTLFGILCLAVPILGFALVEAFLFPKPPRPKTEFELRLDARRNNDAKDKKHDAERKAVQDKAIQDYERRTGKKL